MVGLFFSEVVLFAIAALGGFAIGWRARVMVSANELKNVDSDLKRLRAALSEANVRRANAP